MVATSFGSHPHFVQRLLQIDNDLAPVSKRQCHHATGALVVYIGIGFVVDTVAGGLYPFEQSFGLVHEFGVGHYNFTMLYPKQILVSTLILGAGVLNLVGCGQTGALYLPPPAATTKPAVPSSSGTPAQASTPSSQAPTP
jgi:predicted small lipoprotein YifL